MLFASIFIVAAILLQDEDLFDVTSQGVPILKSAKTGEGILADLLLYPEDIVDLEVNGLPVPVENWNEVLSKTLSPPKSIEKPSKDTIIAGRATDVNAPVENRIADYLANCTVSAIYFNHRVELAENIKNVSMLRKIFDGSYERILLQLEDEDVKNGDPIETFRVAKQRIDAIEKQLAEDVEENLAGDDQKSLHKNIAACGFGRILETPLGQKYFGLSSEQIDRIRRLRVREDALDRMPKTPREILEQEQNPSEQKICVWAERLAVLRDEQIVLLFNTRSTNRQWASATEIFDSWNEVDRERFMRFRE